MIDSHCHLADKKFEPDLDRVIARATVAGVSHMIVIADDLKEGEKNCVLAEKYEQLFYTIGVHPHHASAFSETEFRDALTRHHAHPKCCAIGEIGLDYHYMNSKKSYQLSAISFQLSLAKERNMPAVIHTREAIEDTWQIVDDIKPEKIVLHCCTEKWDDVKRFVERGYLLSFTGIATYPSAADVRDTIRHCPLEHMMVETDAPYLPPEAQRAKWGRAVRNEPAFVIEVAKLIAEIKSVAYEEVDRVTTANAMAFYGIEGGAPDRN